MKATPELIYMKGTIAMLPEEQQAQIEAAAKDIRDAMAKRHPDVSAIALCLVVHEVKSAQS